MSAVGLSHNDISHLITQFVCCFCCCMKMSLRKDPSSVRIRDVLLEMRRYRMGLIQTADQLRFSYLAVIEGAKYIKGDTSLQASPSSPICSVFSLFLRFKFHSVHLFRLRHCICTNGYMCSKK